MCIYIYIYIYICIYIYIYIYMLLYFPGYNRLLPITDATNYLLLGNYLIVFSVMWHE